jgi:hypothetical protein
MQKNRKREKIRFLKKEIQIKDFIIQELLKIITQHKIKVPSPLLKNIIYLYQGLNNVEQRSGNKKEASKEKEESIG